MGKPKENNQKPYRQWILRNFFAVVGSIAILANIWIGIKLTPVLVTLDEIIHDVSANEERIQHNDEECHTLKVEIKGELIYLRDRIDSIYNIIN